MQEVQEDLDRLPLSFSDNPQARLLGICDGFVLEIDQHTNGSPKHPEYLQDMHDEFLKLAEAIRATRPTFEIRPHSTPEPPSSVEVTPCEGVETELQHGKPSYSILTCSNIAQVSAGHNSPKINSRTTRRYSFFSS